MVIEAAILNTLNTPLVLGKIVPPTLKRGQVYVKVLCSGICGAQYNETIGLKGPDKFLPHLLGHEASAIVESVGDGVTKVKRGDYVVLSWIKGRGLDGGSTQYNWNGRTVNAGGITTFSTHAIISENRVTKVSRKIPANIAALLGCVIPTGAGIVDYTLKVKKGSSIIVFGVGGIGLSVILAAKRKGCKNIVGVDVRLKKLQFAKRLGATVGININKQNEKKKLLQMFPSGFDYAVDASGSKQAMETAFALLSNQGTLVIAGNLPRRQKISIHPFELIKGKKIIGTWGGETFPDRDIPKYAKEYLKGILPIEKLITHRFLLKDINKAMQVLKRGNAGRIILEIGRGND